MCLYPIRLQNKKYTVTEKNGGCVPTPPIIGTDSSGLPIYDERILYVQIPCGNCEECRKAKTREWQVRLTEELKEWTNPYFITLTFSPKELAYICKKKRIQECNAAAGYAVRHMLERWRKTHKSSLKHWLITELGHEGTERIHLHGIIFTNEKLEFSKKDSNNMCTWNYWKYGHVYVGEYCSLRTINYIVKYINKIDKDHKGFKGQILASPGIGKNWVERQKQYNPEIYKYRPKRTIDYYTLNTGSRIKLPKYYSNKFRSEEEREIIWREFMDKNQETIAGINYDLTRTSTHSIGRITAKAQEINKRDGYGDNSREWRKLPYNITKQMLQKKHREEIQEELRKKLGMPTIGKV